MSHLPLPRLLVLAALACPAACATPTGPDIGVALRLAAPSFALPGDGAATVAFTVANRSATAVRVTSRCGDRLVPAIERRMGERWGTYAGGICPAVFDASPLPLGPGAERVDTVAIAEPGEYRLVLGTARAPVTSEAFRVR